MMNAFIHGLRLECTLFSNSSVDMILACCFLHNFKSLFLNFYIFKTSQDVLKWRQIAGTFDIKY